jgi:hypothetical protein
MHATLLNSRGKAGPGRINELSIEGASLQALFAIYFKAIAKAKSSRGAVSSSVAEARWRLDGTARPAT